MWLLVCSSSAMLDRVMPKEDVRELGNLSWLAWKMPVLDAWNQSPDATVVTSSSYEEHGRSKANLVDRSMVTEFTSASGPLEEREEWIELRFPESRTFSRLVLHASRTGFPVDFTIEVWNGERWLERVERRGYAPTYGIEIFAWNLVERSDRVRIRATKLTLGEPPLGYVLRFREIGVYE